MENVRRFEDAATVAGLAMSIDELISRIRSYSWQESFIRVADLAAVVANADGGADSEVVRRRTLDPLMMLTGTSTTLIGRIKRYIAERRESMVIAHEEAINYLLHLVLLEGAEYGEAPADTEISLWLLGINDHVSGWRKADDRELSDAEELVALSAHALRFNNSPDLMREIVRSFHLINTAPPRGPLADSRIFEEVHEAAFNGSFSQYFFCFAQLLLFLSKSWGSDLGNDYPIIDINSIYSSTRIDVANGRSWFSSIAATREEAREAIKKRLRQNGLPHAPTALLHRPLVILDNDRYVVASPWMIVALVKTGLWARMLLECKRRFGKAEVWSSAFGDLFEGWCRSVAEDAARQRWFRGELILPSTPGATDEIEDVVLKEGRAAVFFSAKGRLVKESVARWAESRSTLVDWYEEFFFGEKTKDHRVGVVKQLHRRVELLRQGHFEPRMPRSARVLPVILTYDSLCEDVLLYRWLEERCQVHKCLQQKGVGPLTIARVDAFEELMLRASEGDSVVALLRKRENSWKHQRLDRLLFARAGRKRPGKPKRLPIIEELYTEMRRGIAWELFGRET
ncbi:MAG: hypothetical protein MJE77_01605 [Proteobacteria bacterium]|nr:hypothetical protein [Pseudomonadota bacterium]